MQTSASVLVSTKHISFLFVFYYIIFEYIHITELIKPLHDVSVKREIRSIRAARFWFISKPGLIGVNLWPTQIHSSAAWGFIPHWDPEMNINKLLLKDILFVIGSVSVRLNVFNVFQSVYVQYVFFFSEK